MLLMAPLIQPLTIRTVLETMAAIGTVGSLFFYFLSALSLASFLGDRRKQFKQASTTENPTPAGFHPQALKRYRS